MNFFFEISHNIVIHELYEPPPTGTQHTSTPFDSFLLTKKDQIDQDVPKPSEQQAVETLTPEPTAELMDTTANSSEAATTQESQISEDIPTEVNQEQITAEIIYTSYSDADY